MKTYQVYSLLNEEGKRYIGLSENVRERIAQHNSGQSKWTAKYAPWKLDWISFEMTLGEARKLENLLKRQKGGQGLIPLLEEYSADS